MLVQNCSNSNSMEFLQFCINVFGQTHKQTWAVTPYFLFFD